MKKLIDEVKNIRNKPENDRIRIMWLLVVFFMIITIGIGVLEFLNKKSNFERFTAMDTTKIPAYTQAVGSLNKLSEETDKRIELIASEVEKAEMAEIAKKYIEENKLSEIGSIENLKLESISKTDGVWHLNFRQYYKGVPVERSNIGFTIDSSVKIATSSRFDYYPEIDLDVIPKISQEEAFEIAKKESKIDDLKLNSSALIVYSDVSTEPAKNYLAWKLNVMSSGPIYDYNYFVGARNGNIITSYSMIKE